VLEIDDDPVQPGAAHELSGARGGQARPGADEGLPGENPSAELGTGPGRDGHVRMMPG
jgi:hypothetical protein